jgi:hypothetical protein
MVLNRISVWLSLTAAILMAGCSAAGVFLPGTYARETATWATQGRGQDIANLFVVFPATLVALHFAFRGSVRATLVWLGLLIYVVYSYVLYAFFIHFGPWFLVYVAVLGTSAFALFGAVIHMDLSEVIRLLANNPKVKLVSVLLFVFGLLFAFQWLSEIAPALLSGTVPPGVADIGAPVNPVHVLDLAFILPGMIVAAISVRKRGPLGLLFAAPLLTFSAAMGIAILAMFFAEHARGGAISAAPVVVMSGVVLVSIYAVYAFLRSLSCRPVAC